MFGDWMQYVFSDGDGWKNAENQLTKIRSTIWDDGYLYNEYLFWAGMPFPTLGFIVGIAIIYTPRKFNMAAKNRQSQKETHLPTIIFPGLCLISGVYFFFLQGFRDPTYIL